MAIQKNIKIKNRKARFEYEILDTYSAGIVLAGTEIKAIREGKSIRHFVPDCILEELQSSIFYKGLRNG